jgi:hypothetical protein
LFSSDDELTVLFSQQTCYTLYSFKHLAVCFESKISIFHHGILISRQITTFIAFNLRRQFKFFISLCWKLMFDQWWELRQGNLGFQFLLSFVVSFVMLDFYELLEWLKSIEIWLIKRFLYGCYIDV